MPLLLLLLACRRLARASLGEIVSYLTTSPSDASLDLHPYVKNVTTVITLFFSLAGLEISSISFSLF